MKTIKFVLIFFLSILILISIPLIYGYYKYTQIPKIDTNKVILVLGKGGTGHTAPNLTDTIMTVFLNPTTKKTTILSMPRDLWVSEIKAKINTAYHYGGFTMAKDSTKTIIREDVENVVVIDFNVFKEIIDALGGLEVNVEKAFIDNKYPIAGKENDLCGGDKTFACRYETIEFKEGKQVMNGETALKFVRSRNSQSGEGTDIAREKRQQLVILAIKNKLLSPDFLLDVNKLKSVYQVAIGNLETDIDKDTLLIYTKFLIESNFKVETIDFPEDLIKASQNERKYDFQYVFIPKVGTWKEIQEWIRSKV